MKRIGMLLCALVCVGGLVLLVFLVPGLYGPFNWGWGPAPWAWGGLGLPLIGLGMFIVCMLFMGGMMLHGAPFGPGFCGRMMSPHREPLSDILGRRYIQGEITQEQLDEMKKALGVSDAKPANAHGYH